MTWRPTARLTLSRILVSGIVVLVIVASLGSLAYPSIGSTFYSTGSSTETAVNTNASISYSTKLYYDATYWKFGEATSSSTETYLTTAVFATPYYSGCDPYENMCYPMITGATTFTATTTAYYGGSIMYSTSVTSADTYAFTNYVTNMYRMTHVD